jgi:hypothetical protein
MDAGGKKWRAMAELQIKHSNRFTLTCSDKVMKHGFVL